jgi:hypothetical protein
MRRTGHEFAPAVPRQQAIYRGLRDRMTYLLFQSDPYPARFGHAALLSGGGESS